ncbi:hypothetical protein ACJJTC_012620 [Scirpophaga incertulas]
MCDQFNGIKLLNSKDGYSIWKFKMRALLIHEDLSKSVEGYPVSDITTEDMRTAKDQKALAKISLTLDGSAITHVRGGVTKSRTGRRVIMNSTTNHISVAIYR